MAILETLNTLRSRLAGGEGLRGLRGDVAAAKARTLSVEALVKLRTEALALVVEIRSELLDARAQEDKAVRLYARELADQGRDIGGFATDPTKSPLQLKVAERYLSAWADEFGLRRIGDAAPSLGNVIESANERAGMLARVLRERYREHGVPREVAELRARITEATKAEWPLRKAVQDLKDRNNAALWEAEILAAVAELNAAEARTQALRRELTDRFGLQS